MNKKLIILLILCATLFAKRVDAGHTGIMLLGQELNHADLEKLIRLCDEFNSSKSSQTLASVETIQTQTSESHAPGTAPKSEEEILNIVNQNYAAFNAACQQRQAKQAKGGTNTTITDTITQKKSFHLNKKYRDFFYGRTVKRQPHPRLCIPLHKYGLKIKKTLSILQALKIYTKTDL